MKPMFLFPSMSERTPTQYCLVTRRYLLQLVEQAEQHVGQIHLLVFQWLDWQPQRAKDALGRHRTGIGYLNSIKVDSELFTTSQISVF